MSRFERLFGFAVGIASLAAASAVAIFDWQPSLHTVTWVAFVGFGAALLLTARNR